MASLPSEMIPMSSLATYPISNFVQFYRCSEEFQREPTVSSVYVESFTDKYLPQVICFFWFWFFERIICNLFYRSQSAHHLTWGRWWKAKSCRSTIWFMDGTSLESKGATSMSESTTGKVGTELWVLRIFRTWLCSILYSHIPIQYFVIFLTLNNFK